MQTNRFTSYVAYSFCLLTFLLWMSACTTSRKAAFTPVGTWSYTVKNTPNGDVSGNMIITQEGDGYAGRIQSDRGVTDLQDLSVDGNNMTTNLMVDGNQIAIEGLFDQDTFNGKVTAGSDSFDMTASRVE